MSVRTISYLVWATAWTWSALAADPTMQLTIPRTSHPPTLDGKLAPGEWDDAAAVTGIINQFDGIAHPRQATFWLKYDDKNLYVAQRSTLLAGEKRATPVKLPVTAMDAWNRVFDRRDVPEAMPPLYFADNQNTVVIGLAPNRVNSGDTPSWYRFMANITSTNLNRRELCDQIKGVKFVSISSPWDSLEALHAPNHSQALNSFSADDTIWESEYAIPLAELKVEKAPVGEEWGLLLARDYPQQDQNAIVPTTSYRFDYVARNWRNLVVLNAYHLEQEYARARLVEGEPVVQVLALGDLLAGRIQPRLVLSNPTAQATAVTVKLTVGAKAQEKTLTLAAGERKEWQADEVDVPEHTPQVTQVSVKNASGTVLYRQAIPCRAGYGRDRTTLVPDMWLSGEPRGCAGLIVATSEYNPIHNTLWAKLKLAGRPGEEQRTRAEIAVRRPGEDKPFVTYPMTSEVKGVGDYQLKTTLPDLQPGVYEITASLFGKDDQPHDPATALMNASNLNPTVPGQGGKLLARSRDLFIRYDHAKDLPWIGNTIGLTNAVAPPWTPIVTKTTARGLDLSCWGRTYEIDGSGLPTQIQALGRNILTGPVHIEITRAGQSVPLLPAGRISDVHAASHQTEYRGSLQGEGWKITTGGHLEYDGYFLFHIRLEPQGGSQRVDRIQFVVPLTNDDGRYMHAASATMGDMRGSHTTQALRPGKGPLWDSSQQAGGPDGSIGFVVGNFKSYVWVGGVKRGLAFLADNDKDWVPDDSKKVSSIEIVRTDTGVNLVLNLVGRPFTFDHAREITFSLQATPVKPLPDDFRQARGQLYMGTAFVGIAPDGWSWDGCQLWLNGAPYLGGNGTAPFPLNRQRNMEWMHGGIAMFGPTASHIVITKYMAMNAHFHHPEVNDPLVPGLQGANWYGYLTPEIGANRDIGDASMSETEVEYRAWRYQRWIHETGLHGFYFDNSFSGFGANPDAGLGYVIDLPDRPKLNGEIQPGFAWTGIRHLLQRLHNVILAEGQRPYLWLHGTDTFVAGAYSFADFVLDGEEGPDITPAQPWFSEKWSPGYMQTLNDSSKWGFAVHMLELIDQLTGPANTAQWRPSLRDLCGYLMLHDSESSTYRYLDWNGLDLSRKAEFLPYWDPAVAVALDTGKTNVFASAWRQDNALRVEVFNHSGQSQKNLTLRIDPKALGLAPANGQTLGVKDVEAGAPKDGFNWPGDVGLSFQHDRELIKVTMDILPHDYRLLRVE